MGEGTSNVLVGMVLFQTFAQHAGESVTLVRYVYLDHDDARLVL